MKKIAIVLAALVSILLVAGCGGGGTKVFVVIDPPAWEMTISTTKQFTGYTTGIFDDTVTWSVKETSGGSITSDGLYTAPGTAGTYHVVATSNEDSTAKATATVIVTN